MKLNARVRRLAKVLKMDFDASSKLYVEKGKDGRWWLLGCLNGDQPLPMTRGAHTATEAVESAEAWLMPEVVLDETRTRRSRNVFRAI